MIKPLLFLLLIFTLSNVSADKSRSYALHVLRQEYLAASKDEDTALSFNKKMSAYAGNDPVVLAYKATSEAVMAKYYWNPYSKLKQLRAAAATFEAAVALDKSNPEIRFLRFTVEHYVPRYLNMSEHLSEDKRLIINALKSHPKSGMSAEMALMIRDFMLSKDHSTEAEKQEIKSVKLN